MNLSKVVLKFNFSKNCISEFFFNLLTTITWLTVSIDYVYFFFWTACKSMDIRNNISQLNQLANCTVIEGFLLISLINDADKLNRTYPLLTEVKGYIVVYRVTNLISLSQIFPNLTIIRGNSLFESYALVVYSNRDLQDIGLTNLRTISHGGVRIEKNEYLCFCFFCNRCCW